MTAWSPLRVSLVDNDVQGVAVRIAQPLAGERDMSGMQHDLVGPMSSGLVSAGIGRPSRGIR